MEETWLTKSSDLFIVQRVDTSVCSDRSDSGVTMPSTQPHDLQGQTALVTGATSGIGRAVAVQLAREGAEVIVHGRDAARGNEVVQEIVAAGGTARFIAADLGDPADVRHLAEEAGEIDVLVNNAGFAAWG